MFSIIYNKFKFKILLSEKQKLFISRNQTTIIQFKMYYSSVRHKTFCCFPIFFGNNAYFTLIHPRKQTKKFLQLDRIHFHIHGKRLKSKPIEKRVEKQRIEIGKLLHKEDVVLCVVNTLPFLLFMYCKTERVRVLAADNINTKKKLKFWRKEISIILCVHMTHVQKLQGGDQKYLISFRPWYIICFQST